MFPARTLKLCFTRRLNKQVSLPLGKPPRRVPRPRPRPSRPYRMPPLCHGEREDGAFAVSLRGSDFIRIERFLVVSCDVTDDADDAIPLARKGATEGAYHARARVPNSCSFRLPVLIRDSPDLFPHTQFSLLPLLPSLPPPHSSAASDHSESIRKSIGH